MRRRVAVSKLAIVGFVALGLVVALALGAGLVTNQDPALVDIAQRIQPPSWEFGTGSHPFGTDGLGRDVLSRVAYGARVSLFVGVSVVAISGLIGVSLGLIAGYRGRFTDAVIMRLADVQLAFPFVLVALTVLAVTGPGLWKLVLVLGLTRWVAYARVVRGQVLVERELEYVFAARTIGVGDAGIVIRHILPNIRASIIVVSTFSVSTAILAESALSFLGLGVEPAVPTWGGMLTDGREYVQDAWWLTAFPGAALTATVLGANAVGDWLRDHLDPRLRV